jgi:hypothetical protein
MKRDRSFLQPIILEDGAAVVGLTEAETLIRNLPAAVQQSARWKYASELIVRAFERDEKYTTMDVRAQVERALKQDGLA